jgi:hypothetical protein
MPAGARTGYIKAAEALEKSFVKPTSLSKAITHLSEIYSIKAQAPLFDSVQRYR